MATTTKRAGQAVTTPEIRRRDELRQLLEDRRREILATLHDRMKGVRAEGSTLVSAGVLDEEEASEADVQEDIELALIEMKAETLRRIDEALGRLDAGLYGRCDACGEDIAHARLRALPFAVRCRDCEELHETDRRRARTADDRQSARHGYPDRFDPTASGNGR